MDETVRLRMRTAHAKYAYYCTCGKVVHGNGGRASHEYMHERKQDGHRFVTERSFRERFPEKYAMCESRYAPTGYKCILWANHEGEHRAASDRWTDDTVSGAEKAT
jgi:hypothetical protein